MERRLFVLQRLSAMLLAPFVLVHLGVGLYALHRGLTAADILGRTESSLAWALFYGVFVLAAAVHAPIGLRNVLIEWTPAPAGFVNRAMILFGLLLFILGLVAVWAAVD